MKTLILIFIISHISLFSDWKEIESPKSIQSLRNINSGSDYIIGGDFDPYFSFDGGETWNKRINGLQEEMGTIEQIEVENDLIVFNTLSSFKFERQFVFYSTDKGENWQNLTEKIDSNLKISDIKIDNELIYILSAFSRKIYKSSDLGNSWDSSITWDVNNFSPRYFEVNNDTIVMADRGGNIVGGSTKNGGIIISTDEGKNWEERSQGLSTSNMNCLKLVDHNIYVGGDNGFYYSEDFGLTWKSPGAKVVNISVKDIEVIEDTVYIATELGLFKAKDLFKGWEEISYFNYKRVWEIHFAFDKLFARSLNIDYTNDYSYYSEVSDYSSFKKLNFLNKSTLRNFSIYYPNIYISSKTIDFKDDLTSEFNNIFETDSTFELSKLSTFNNNIVCTYLPTFANAKIQTIFYSTDKGENWDKTELSIENTDFNIYDLFLLNNDTLLVSTNLGIYLSFGFKNELVPLNSNDSIINSVFPKVHTIFKNRNKIFYYGKGAILESDTNLKNWKNYSKKVNSNSSIFDFSKDKNNLYLITHSGGQVDPSTLSLLHSSNNGENWVSIKEKFSAYLNFWPQKLFNIDEYVFISTQSGLFFSNDNAQTFLEINEGISSSAKKNGGDFYIYGDTILYCSSVGIYYRPLSELGITLSTEKTKKRNYLWTYPPYPHPTNSILKVETYWDYGLPFSEKDVEIYNITGLKINTNETLTLQKESNNRGHIIWDVSNQNPGIYIMKITHGTERRIRKIMVVE